MSSLSINRAAATSLPSKVSANSAAAQVFPNLLVPANPVFLTAPSGGTLDQKAFRVRASGYATTAGNFTVLITLWAGIVLPTIAAPGTIIGVSTARAQNTISAPWMIEANLIMDSVSGRMHGTQKAVVNNLFDAEAAIAAAITGITPGQGGAEPAVYFAVGITFGTGNVGNIGNLGDFVLDE
jgi:hypothetical protein